MQNTAIHCLIPPPTLTPPNSSLQTSVSEQDDVNVRSQGAYQNDDAPHAAYRASERTKLALLKPTPGMLRTINEAKTVFRATGATIEGFNRED